MTESVIEFTTQTLKLPPVPGGLGLGCLCHRLTDGLGFEKMKREYGDIVYFRILGREYCVVYDPNVLEEIFVAKRSSFIKGLFLQEHRYCQ